ncbi:putative oxidoreductase [Magnetospirillum gryphiswaldense MSR-1 v2]|uniref:Arsenate reductase n=2 Tax=Magnetospirillum gryphiswaldense TaxID=55518 RepID=V6F5X4_MAGGM|nr:putative oxidoreductase [Magnetospirillum gryphiswaldense MSR-1 v2]
MGAAFVVFKDSKRMTEVTIYHNPRCSKSRETLKLLEDQGVTPRVVEYLKTPPSAALLAAILAKLGKGPKDIIRKKEVAEVGIDVGGLSDQALIAALAANPTAIERPIVVKGDKAALGRPPENVLTIL